MSTYTKKPVRRRKLIKTRLQLKIVGTFVAIALLPLLLQTLVMSWLLSEAATTLPTGGSHLMMLVPALLQKSFMVSVCFLLPLTICVGILSTFRVAGPIFRFERYLHGIAQGAESEPCRIRKGDELQELCDAINVATEPLRGARPESQERSAPSERAA